MPSCCNVELVVQEDAATDLDVADERTIEWESSEYVPYRPVIDEYHGAYSLVPAPTAQTLDTAGLLMLENVTIEPIPSNYGLISWDGAALTVS